MQTGVLQPGAGPAVRRGAGVLPDGGQLPVLDRPVHHHHRPARGPGGHGAGAVRHPDDLQRALADGGDHERRRGDGEHILVVTFANEQRLAGMDARQAALEAGRVRLRPVLMTALAMVLGMLPMSLGLGEGGEQNAALGRAVIGGLVGATVATLLFVPVIYSLIRANARLPVADPDLVAGTAVRDCARAGGELPPDPHLRPGGERLMRRRTWARGWLFGDLPALAALVAAGVIPRLQRRAGAGRAGGAAARAAPGGGGRRPAGGAAVRAGAAGDRPARRRARSSTPAWTASWASCRPTWATRCARASCWRCCRRPSWRPSSAGPRHAWASWIATSRSAGPRRNGTPAWPAAASPARRRPTRPAPGPTRAEASLDSNRAEVGRLSALYRLPAGGGAVRRGPSPAAASTGGRWSRPASTALFEIAQTRTLKVFVDVPQSLAGDVQTGHAGARCSPPRRPARVATGQGGAHRRRAGSGDAHAAHRDPPARRGRACWRGRSCACG